MHPCPLCAGAPGAPFFRDRRREYFRCPACALVFVDPAALPGPEAERERYARHQNHPLDPGYRGFLARLARPLDERLGRKGQSGLDFGCGPGPTLSVMLEELGYQVRLYDPFFAPDRSALGRRYDFITCSEAIEHFHSPGREWQLLRSLLAPGGWLGVMTTMVGRVEDFAVSSYRQDLTHVSFFSRETFSFLARRDRLELEFEGDDVVFFRSGAPGTIT